MYTVATLMPMRGMHCVAGDGVQQQCCWRGLYDCVLCSGLTNRSIKPCTLIKTLCTTWCIARYTSTRLCTTTQWCCEEEMQGEMTTLSTCLLSTVSPDGASAHPAVPTHEMHTMYACNHCHTIVHVEYAHTHERHALHGRVGRHCSPPTMLVVLQSWIQDGEMQDAAQNTCQHTGHICTYTFHCSYMQSHSMPSCCTCCNGMRWYILPQQPTTQFHPRIMNFVVMPHTPITFNNKTRLLTYVTSRIHLHDKQHVSHSFTMHAARVEWRPHFTLPPLPFPPFIMYIHPPMYYIP